MKNWLWKRLWTCRETDCRINELCFSICHSHMIQQNVYSRHYLQGPRKAVCKTTFIVVCFLLGNSPASEFYMPTFRNTLSHLHRQVGMKYFIPTCLRRWNRQCLLDKINLKNSVPKRRHIKFKRRGITQKKAYNIQKKAKV